MNNKLALLPPNEEEFEYNFYHSVAGGEFEVIPIPCSDGYVLTDSEKAYIAQLSLKNKTKLLYSIKLEKYYVVFGIEGNGKIGIIPINKNSFHC